MTIQLHTFLSQKLVDQWGDYRESWEINLYEILGFPVRLSSFFWEVENILSVGCFPEKISIDCDLLNGWYPIVYQENLRRDLGKYILQKLISVMMH